MNYELSKPCYFKICLMRYLGYRLVISNQRAHNGLNVLSRKAYYFFYKKLTNKEIIDRIDYSISDSRWWQSGITIKSVFSNNPNC